MIHSSDKLKHALNSRPYLTECFDMSSLAATTTDQEEALGAMRNIVTVAQIREPGRNGANVAERADIGTIGQRMVAERFYRSGQENA